MSFPLLARSTSPAPPPPAAIPQPPSLSQRVHIPSHIYKHPTAILLELCNSMKELYQILPHIIKNGLYKEHLFETKLVGLFTKYGSLNDATKVFDFAKLKVDPMYHTMLKGHTHHSTLDSSLAFYSRLRYDNITPVIYNFSYLLKACADNSDVVKGKQVHAQLILHGFSDSLFAMTSVVNLYAKCGMVGDAYKMFDRMPERDLVCWNTVISGHAQNGMSKRALELVLRMQEEGCNRPDSVTVVSILPACAAIGSLKMGKSIHGYIFRNGLESLVNVLTALVDMYAKCGSVGTARLVFDKMDSKTVVSLNAMIDGYARNGYYDEALIIFQRMLDEGFKPTNVTIMSTLHACAESRNIELGQHVHKLVNQLGLGSNVAVVNSLISMYCKGQRVDIATELFENMKERTLVSWNAMILGYAQNGRVVDALTHFCKMHLQNIKPDSFTMVSVVTALAELSVLRQAKWIHGFAVRTCLNRNIFVATALVDMYANLEQFTLQESYLT